MLRVFKTINLKNIKKLLLCIAFPLGFWLLSDIYMSDAQCVYDSLIRSSLAPPLWIFNVVWPICYILAGIASYYVWIEKCDAAQKGRAIWMYIIQLIISFFWGLIFFDLQYRGLALIWILLLLFLVVLTAVSFYDIRRISGWLMLPYVAWLAFVLYLNYTFWMLNR